MIIPRLRAVLERVGIIHVLERAMNMIRKGQINGLEKGDIRVSVRRLNETF